MVIVSRHLTLLFSAIRYGLSWVTLNYYSTWAKISYRTAFVAAAATYGIVVYKAYRARMRAGSRPQGGLLSLITDENVQYLGKSTTCISHDRWRELPALIKRSPARPGLAISKWTEADGVQ